MDEPEFKLVSKCKKRKKLKIDKISNVLIRVRAINPLCLFGNSLIIFNGVKLH